MIYFSQKINQLYNRNKNDWPQAYKELLENSYLCSGLVIYFIEKNLFKFKKKNPLF